MTMKAKERTRRSGELREQAENLLKNKGPEAQQSLPKDFKQLIHELQVYQVELEIQNEQLRDAQMELETSRTKYLELYDFAPLGYFTLDRNGIIEEVNLTGAKLLSIERRRLFNRGFHTFVKPETRPEFHSHLKKVFNSGTKQRCELELFKEGKEDNNSLFVSIESIAFGDCDGLQTRSLSAVLDITERKRAEEQQRQMEAQLQHTQKLESLGILAGGIAHDFNNLLAAILGNASLARSELPSDSPIFDCLREVETAAERAADLANQMLAYSGKGSFVRMPFSLNQVIQEMSDLLQRVISKKITLKLDLRAKLPKIEGDVTQIRQVIMNLITNASEAVEEKSGTITVSTGVLKVGRDYLRACYLKEDLPEGDYVYLEVADTGEGVAQETLSKIFDPFFTTKFTGRGLGLAAVLGIVRSHQGNILVESAPGRGTKFRVILPPSAKEAPAIKARKQTEAWHGTGTILVVDDDQAVRRVAKRMLEKSGITILTAGDGREGVNVFREHAPEIRAVLLDLTMPNLDGVEAFDEFYKINKDVRVILSSGFSEQEAQAEFAEKGFAGFIQKPYTPTELLQKVRVALEE